MFSKSKKVPPAGEADFSYNEARKVKLKLEITGDVAFVMNNMFVQILESGRLDEQLRLSSPEALSDFMKLTGDNVETVLRQMGEEVPSGSKRRVGEFL